MAAGSPLRVTRAGLLGFDSPKLATLVQELDFNLQAGDALHRQISARRS